MKFDTTMILLLGGAAIAGWWCFTQGPCKDLLNKAPGIASIGAGAGARATGAAQIGDLSHVGNMDAARALVQKTRAANYTNGWY